MSAHDILAAARDLELRVQHLAPAEQLAALQAAFVTLLGRHARTVETAERALTAQVETMRAQLRVRFRDGRRG